MFKNIWRWIKKTASGAVAWLRPRAETAIKVVNAVKELVENPLVGDIVNLTPFKGDDAVLQTLKDYLPKVAEPMLVAERVLQAGNHPDVIMATLLDYLRSKSKEARVKFWVELQAQLTVVLADGKVSLQEAIAIGQLVYKEVGAS